MKFLFVWTALSFFSTTSLLYAGSFNIETATPDKIKVKIGKLQEELKIVDPHVSCYLQSRLKALEVIHQRMNLKPLDHYGHSLQPQQHLYDMYRDTTLLYKDVVKSFHKGVFSALLTPEGDLNKKWSLTGNLHTQVSPEERLLSISGRGGQLSIPFPKSFRGEIINYTAIIKNEGPIFVGFEGEKLTKLPSFRERVSALVDLSLAVPKKRELRFIALQFSGKNSVSISLPSLRYDMLKSKDERKKSQALRKPLEDLLSFLNFTYAQILKDTSDQKGNGWTVAPHIITKTTKTDRSPKIDKYEVLSREKTFTFPSIEGEAYTLFRDIPSTLPSLLRGHTLVCQFDLKSNITNMYAAVLDSQKREIARSSPHSGSGNYEVLEVTFTLPENEDISLCPVMVPEGMTEKPFVIIKEMLLKRKPITTIMTSMTATPTSTAAISAAAATTNKASLSTLSQEHRLKQG